MHLLALFNLPPLSRYRFILAFGAVMMLLTGAARYFGGETDPWLTRGLCIISCTAFALFAPRVTAAVQNPHRLFVLSTLPLLLHILSMFAVNGLTGEIAIAFFCSWQCLPLRQIPIAGLASS